jgi:hypothetical protein
VHVPPRRAVPYHAARAPVYGKTADTRCASFRPARSGAPPTDAPVPIPGKFLAMPAGAKKPPPQQSSLADMWGGGGAKGKKLGKKDAPKEDSAEEEEVDAMEVEAKAKTRAWRDACCSAALTR